MHTWKRLLLSAVLMVCVTATPGAFAGVISLNIWGCNLDGQRGDGTTGGCGEPVRGVMPGFETGVTVMAAGYRHSMVVQDGVLWAWGANDYGQLGFETEYSEESYYSEVRPVAVPWSGIGVTALAAGREHSLAIRGGALYSWGDNFRGQLGDTRPSGEANPTPTLVTGFETGVTAIAAGEYYSLAIRDGAVYAWGANWGGVLGNGVADGNTYNDPAPVKGLESDVTAIEAGIEHAMAIRDGGLYVWGSNYYGQLGDGTTDDRYEATVMKEFTTGVTAIAAGYYMCLVVQGGLVYAWGSNEFGQLGQGEEYEEFYSSEPLQVGEGLLMDIVEVAAGEYACYALGADGRLWAWGRNHCLGLGFGFDEEEIYWEPTLVGEGFTSINLNHRTMLALGAPVPEPATMALLVTGAVGVLARRR